MRRLDILIITERISEIAIKLLVITYYIIGLTILFTFCIYTAGLLAVLCDSQTKLTLTGSIYEGYFVMSVSIMLLQIIALLIIGVLYYIFSKKSNNSRKIRLYFSTSTIFILCFLVILGIGLPMIPTAYVLNSVSEMDSIKKALKKEI